MFLLRCLGEKMKKLQNILNKKEFEIVKSMVKKKAEKKPGNFISHMADLRFKCLLEGIYNVKDPASLCQIKLLLEEKHPKIGRKLNDYIKKTFPKGTVPFIE